MSKQFRSIHPQQMQGWVGKLQSNMREFLDKETTTSGEKIAFIRNQYLLINTVTGILESRIYLTGCTHSIK